MLSEEGFDRMGQSVIKSSAIIMASGHQVIKSLGYSFPLSSGRPSIWRAVLRPHSLICQLSMEVDLGIQGGIVMCR